MASNSNWLSGGHHTWGNHGRDLLLSQARRVRHRGHWEANDLPDAHANTGSPTFGYQAHSSAGPTRGPEPDQQFHQVAIDANWLCGYHHTREDQGCDMSLRQTRTARYLDNSGANESPRTLADTASAPLGCQLSLIGKHFTLLSASQGARRAQHCATGNRSHNSLYTRQASRRPKPHHHAERDC